MKNTRNHFKPYAGIRWLRALAACVLVAACLPGCGGLRTAQAWAESEEVQPSRENVVVVESVKRKPVLDEANKFALMALFAKVAYRNDLPEKVRSAQGCDYLAKDAPVLRFGMPFKADGSHWERWKGSGKDDEKPCLDKGGLFYETYVHRTDKGVIDEAVIAFRGTENYNAREAMEDWMTNLAAFAGFEPPQYVSAQAFIPKVVEGIRSQAVSQGADIRIYVTGHSLGAGLAQQAGYLDARISEVFAFDPDPVTNWNALVMRNAKARNECEEKLSAALRSDKDAVAGCRYLVIKNPDPVIHRVYHWHEGLAYVRNVTSRFNSRRFGRSDYEFYFQDAKAITAHEMGILTCYLAKSIKGDEADHGYTREFAMSVISPDYGKHGQVHPVCPSPAVDRNILDAFNPGKR
ncbi:MAG: DUF6792 domain-containing protein [Pseudomonadota bacterium]